MFIVGETGDDVNEYTLSTGFDLSSIVTFVDSFAVTQCPNPTAVKFNVMVQKCLLLVQTTVMFINMH